MMYSIWLLPKKEDHELLGSVISRLSGTYNGKKFSPHLTAFGDISADPQLIEKATRDSIRNIEPFTVKISGIEFSDYIFKAAYISLEINSQLQTINQKLQDSLSEYSDYKFAPHISLLYGVVDQARREKILKDVKIKEEFSIDKISVTMITEKVENWKTVAGPFNLGAPLD